MKIHTSDKAIAWLTLLSGLTISAVAIYYSVAGLTAIFAAAVTPIVVMGVALEISKLAATVWLKQNWSRAPNFIRGYLLAAILILMLITSMGIFGFLSKAHSDQSLVSGDVQSKIAVYDEKIKTEKENIEANRKALKQMDDALDQVLGRSTDEKGADKAVAIRRSQQKERTRLQKEILQSQQSISQLNDARAPIAAEVRKVEAEVGPIKYIANFIYGDNPEANVLEKAVTWVIIIIVIVFDPLAVILLLASQYSFMWFRQQQDEDDEMRDEYDFSNAVRGPVIKSEGDSPEKESDVVSTATVTESESIDDTIPQSQNIIVNETLEPAIIAEELPVEEIVIESFDEDENHDDTDILEQVHGSEKADMQAWKHDHPDSSLKQQKRLLARGIIEELPWTDYVNRQKSNIDAVDRPGDYISWMENVDGHQVKKTKEDYQQNAEQSERTLWQRIQDAKK